MKIKILLICLFFSSCVGSKLENITNMTDIYFGSGGGVTGEVTEYHLNSKGEFFYKDLKVTTLKSKTVVEIFKEADRIKDIKFINPKNNYSYLRIKTKNQNNLISWGITSRELDENVKLLHKKLFTFVKN